MNVSMRNAHFNLENDVGNDLTAELLRISHADKRNDSLICRFSFCKFLCTWKCPLMEPAVCVHRHCLSPVFLHINRLWGIFDKLQQALNSHVVCLEGQMSEDDGLSESSLCHSIRWKQKSLMINENTRYTVEHKHILTSQRKTFPNRPTARTYVKSQTPIYNNVNF